jgi:hypothetical protein
MARSCLSLASPAKLGVRHASTLPPRKGRKGKLYQAEVKQLAVTPEERVRITKRRMEKAERDERIDITLALTPVKTYVSLSDPMFDDAYIDKP